MSNLTLKSELLKVSLNAVYIQMIYFELITLYEGHKDEDWFIAVLEL